MRRLVALPVVTVAYLIGSTSCGPVHNIADSPYTYGAPSPLTGTFEVPDFRSLKGPPVVKVGEPFTLEAERDLAGHCARLKDTLATVNEAEKTIKLRLLFEYVPLVNLDCPIERGKQQYSFRLTINVPGRYRIDAGLQGDRAGSFLQEVEVL